MKTRIALVDFAERILSTFAISFLTVVLASPGARVSYKDALLIAAFAAFASFVTTVAIWAATLNKGITNPYVDLVYRAAVTFVQNLAAYAGAAGTISALDFHWTFALKLSLIAAGTSALKALIGLNNPMTLGASPVVVPVPVRPRPKPEPGDLPVV